MAPLPEHARGAVLIRVDRCKGCELCIEFCPVGVLALSEGFNLDGYHYPVVLNDGCISCQACSAICPEFAIFALPAQLLPRARELGLAV
jgi:2-oxoglutarate ferredoxin oxidoreductase subunit delta